MGTYEWSFCDSQERPDGTIDVSAKFAIAAGGYVKLELAAAGTPALLVSIVDHQAQLAEVFSRRSSSARYLGPIEDVSPEFVLGSLKELQADQDLHQSMSRAGMNFVDGDGADRILDAIDERWRAEQRRTGEAA